MGVFVQLDGGERLYRDSVYPRCRFAPRSCPDGPSINELSQTRPFASCEIVVTIRYIHDGAPQTNNREHNENQYSHE